MTRNDGEMYAALTIKETVENVNRDGFESFRIHFNNFSDDFRKETQPERLVEEKPAALDPRIYSLAAATVSFLCKERGLTPPDWVERKDTILRDPWFPSGVLNFRAMELRDSPSAFKFRNIFVGKDIYSRI